MDLTQLTEDERSVVARTWAYRAESERRAGKLGEKLEVSLARWQAQPLAPAPQDPDA